MAIMLPSGGVKDWAFRLVPQPTENRSAYGTNLSRSARLGRHFAFDVALTLLDQAEALDWSDLDEETETLVWPIDQGDLQAANEGAPRVAGAGQGGNALDLDGVTPGYVVNKGAFVSVIISGRRYCYTVRAARTADAGGLITLPVRPLIRVPPPDDAVVEIASPKVEGYVTAAPLKFEYLHRSAGRTFTIEERG
ncbi:MAG: hypothetical protein ABL308_12670 [Oceanicaulis sp.]